MVDSKSPYTFGHSSRVAQYADAVAVRVGLTPERRRWLYRGALLHDIGKLGVSNTVLDKPGSLTPEEWEIMKQHPNVGLSILDGSSLPGPDDRDHGGGFWPGWMRSRIGSRRHGAVTFWAGFELSNAT